METKNLKKPFLEEMDRGGVWLQCGVRHSGKTVFGSAVIRHAMEKDMFDFYDLVIPTYGYQAKDTFCWLETLPDKIKNKITIYQDFSVLILDFIIERQKSDKFRGTKTFFYMDDATAITELSGPSIEQFKIMTTQARHLGICMWLTFHHVKRILTPQIRGSCSFFVIHRLPDIKILETIWEENMSLWYDKNTWLDFCRKTMREDYPCVVVHRDKAGGVDDKAMDGWDFIKKQRDIILKEMDSSIPDKKKKPCNNVSKTEKHQAVHKDGGGAKKNQPVVVQSSIQSCKGIKVPFPQPSQRQLHPFNKAKHL